MELLRLVPEFMTDPTLTRAAKTEILLKGAAIALVSAAIGGIIAVTDWEGLFSDPPPSYSRSASTLPPDVQKALYLPTPQIPR